jgi:hypothetical protein
MKSILTAALVALSALPSFAYEADTPSRAIMIYPDSTPDDRINVSGIMPWSDCEKVVAQPADENNKGSIVFCVPADMREGSISGAVPFTRN